MSAATLPPTRKRFTRFEVEQMLNSGLFIGQRFELIEGDLIEKASQNPPHAQAVTRIAAWLTRLFDERVRTQQPIEVAGVDRNHSWPEPDVAVVASEEVAAAMGARQPRGDELRLVVEVADSSSRFDLTVKRDINARASVPEYWVLDLAARRLVTHRTPVNGAYADVDVVKKDGAVSLDGCGDTALGIARLLAPLT